MSRGYLCAKIMAISNFASLPRLVAFNGKIGNWAFGGSLRSRFLREVPSNIYSAVAKEEEAKKIENPGGSEEDRSGQRNVDFHPA